MLAAQLLGNVTASLSAFQHADLVVMVYSATRMEARGITHTGSRTCCAQIDALIPVDRGSDRTLASACSGESGEGLEVQILGVGGVDDPQRPRVRRGHV
jgi:hypothetical protein